MPESSGNSSFGLIIARTATASENAVSSLELALDMLSQGTQVGIFLIGDGIYLGKKGRTPASVLISDIIAKGAKVYASPEHIKASGLSRERLIPGIEIVEDTYRDLVDFIMERYEKVISC